MPALMPSELPEVARTKHHWIVLLRPPGLWPTLAGLGVFVLAVIWPLPWLMLFVVLVGAVAFLRWQTWQAELIVLTRKRIIRVQGVPETTTSEAFLRIDRVSGARLVQTVPGKILDYGTIELEAPGDHPDVRRLHKIPNPAHFYDLLRQLVFDEHQPPDPDEPTGYPGPTRGPSAYPGPTGYPDPSRYPTSHPGQYVTEPLPRLDDPPRRRS